MRSLEAECQNYRSGTESEKIDYPNSNRYGHTPTADMKNHGRYDLPRSRKQSK